VVVDVCMRFMLYFFINLSIPLFSSLFPYTTLFRSVLAIVVVAPQPLPAAGIAVAGIAAAAAIEARPEFATWANAATRQWMFRARSEEHTSELQSRENLVCRHLHEKK